MESAKQALCLDDPFNPFITTTLQGSGILVISHIFHILLKPLGQPGPVAQILAGIVLGPSLLSRIEKVNEFFIQSSSAVYYNVFTTIFCILFMFLIGLETDIPYLKRHFRETAIVASGGMIICGVFGIAVSFFVMNILEIKTLKSDFVVGIIVMLSNTALPIVIRLTTELKIATASVGRLSIASALISEMVCVFLYTVFTAFQTGHMFGVAIGFLLLTVVIVYANQKFAILCNRRYQRQKYIGNTPVLAVLVCLILISFGIEDTGYTSILFSFIAGLVYPRDGKMTRTMIHKLDYAVNNFILPIYFGYLGFRLDLSYFYRPINIIMVVLMILLSIGGKIIGTLFACHYLNIPMTDGILVSFFLNMKGHAEIMYFERLAMSQEGSLWNQDVYNLVTMVVVLSSVISGPAVTCILMQNRNYFAHTHTLLEPFDSDTELGMLTCVYDSRHITSKLGLIWVMSGSLTTPITAYLMHLVELPKKHRKKNLMYHQLNDGDQYSDEEDYGGNNVLEINDAIDSFATETKLLIRQSKVVSSFGRIYEDVCDTAEDFRVSIVLLTFHKHQRLDGKLESGKEGIRTTNQKVLRHAPCSVGIFVDRGQTGFQQPNSDCLQNVATLFFGGVDDCEALACSRRLASHPHIKLTLIRFLPISVGKDLDDTANKNKNVELLMETPPNQEIGNEFDNRAVEDFYNRYVSSGQARYEEKFINTAKETVEALSEIREIYSLFIVGRGARGECSMTTGMSDWEECPELGPVGDLLASAEFNVNGSVLVIQQHRHYRNQIRNGKL